MQNFELSRLILRLRGNDMSVFVPIYNSFKGLIETYAARLDEDGSAELTLHLMEILYSVDLDRFNNIGDGLSRYIAVCLRNKYILLSRKLSLLQKSSDELTGLFPYHTAANNLELKEALAQLSEKQRLTVILKYIEGYSDFEIAKRLGISRQAVCKTKGRAIKILKNYYGG